MIPIPLNIIPLPVQWTIKFLPPISLAHYSPDQAGDKKIVHAEARRIRRLLQRAIIEELRERKQGLISGNDLEVD